MSEPIYLSTIGLPLLTLLLIFGMRYWSLARQAHARFAADQAYRPIAESAARTQSEIAGTLAEIQVTLVDLGTRLTAVEHILKQVE